MTTSQETERPVEDDNERNGARAVETARLEAFDADRVEAAVRELLIGIGEDPDREGLRDTPARVARSYRELFAGLFTEPSAVLERTFSEDHDELVLVRDIPLFSMCEHHLLPFSGVAHVAYLPGSDGRVTGLSKLARLVDLYARRPQVQERLTTQVADALDHTLGARGVLVVIDAEHQCMSARGVRKPGSRTTTSAVRGILKSSASTRAEALGLIRH
ncbi:GTP cyclohydrolase I FolE [Actinomycetospora sp. CA-084318]|uniref:GTP cyclohydrolase I FolE n=1 Tax=Actinomycetospora sp. CA-084318 TaxID=3239892 RepID=UPI003D96FB8C